jgi:hypothetical protein
MATLTGKLVADTYKALLKLIDNDILTASEKQISDGFGGGSNVFIDQNGFLRAVQYKVTGGTSSQFLKADGSLDSTSYLPTGTTTSAIAEGSRLYFTTARVLNTTLTGFVATSGTVTASDTILTAIDKIWWNIVNGGGGGGGYVPYTGATQNLNLGTYGLISDFVQFNTTNSAIPVGAGTMSWNNTDGTADLRLKGGNVTLQVGQELVTRIVNKTGDDLLEENYQAVYISGAQGQRLKVDLALATTDATSAGTLGLVTEDIDNNQEGFITTSGLVNKIDTTGDLQGETWADGDILYLSPTVAGQITNVKPLAPDHTVIMGFVVYAHANNGKIYVKVDNGYEIEELHDVQVIDRTDEDILQWYEDDLVWRNINLLTAITNAGGISGLGDINYVPKFDTVNSITNSLIYDDGSQVFINDDGTYYSVNSKLTVVGGNLTVDDNWGIHLGLYQILFRYDVTGELRFGTGVLDDFITFFANSTEKARLSALGYLGVGLTDPSHIIHAKDSTAYGKIIIDNTGATGGGSFSARQNGTETAIFGVSGAWQANTTSDAAIVATRASQGIKFYTNGSATAKGGIDSVGNSFIGQLPAYYAGATNFIVQGISAAAMIGVTHMDNSIKGVFSTLNGGVTFGSYTPHPVIFRADDIESARIASDGKWLFGTVINDNVNLLQVNGSIIATAFKKTGGLATEFLKADGSVDNNTYYLESNPYSFISLTELSSSATGLSYSNTTGDFSLTAGYVIPTTASATNWDTAYTNRITFAYLPLNIADNDISINLATTSTDGYLSSTDWNTFNNKSNTTGTVTSVAMSVPTGLSISGSPITTLGTLELTLAAGYSIPTTSSQSNWDTAYNNRITSATAPLSIALNVISIGLATSFSNGYLSSTDWNTFNGKQAALGFTPVTNARTLTINGTTYDLTADRSWTIAAGISTLTTLGTSGPATLVGSTLNVPNYSAGSSAVRNVSTFTATSGQTTFTIIGGYTVGLIDVFINGARLSTADYTATNSTTVVLGTGAVLNDIVDVVNYTATFTAGISGTGTANFLTKWTGTSTVSNSLIFDNGTNVGIGTITPNGPLSVQANTGNTAIRLIGTAQASSNNASIVWYDSNDSTFNGYLGNFSASFDFYNQRNTPMTFSTNGIERIRISGTGNFGIGTTNPLAPLSVQANTGNTAIRLIGTSQSSSNNAGIFWYNSNNSTFNGYIGNFSGSFDFYNERSTPMIFYTNASEAKRITSAGFTKMSNNGTYSNSTGTYHELRSNISGNYSTQIANTNASPFGLQVYYPNTLNNTTNRFLDCEDNTALRFSVRSNGGLANYQANNVNLSDIRTKKDIILLESYWNKFKALEIVKFKYKDQTHDDFNIGVIAQQVESVAPEFVDIDGWGNMPNQIANNDDKMKSIYTSDLYHATIKVLQEAMNKIEILENKIDQLKAI